MKNNCSSASKKMTTSYTKESYNTNSRIHRKTSVAGDGAMHSYRNFQYSDGNNKSPRMDIISDAASSTSQHVQPIYNWSFYAGARFCQPPDADELPQPPIQWVETASTDLAAGCLDIELKQQNQEAK